MVIVLAAVDPIEAMANAKSVAVVDKSFFKMPSRIKLQLYPGGYLGMFSKSKLIKINV